MSTVSNNERVLSTLNDDGSRRWIKPRPAAGRFHTRRKIVGYGLIAFFVTLPHLRVAGMPPVLIDIPAREFTFIGTTLYPTDTLLFALLMLSVFLTIFFLTAVLGRVWCGWACPQTVYLELVYRPIERLLHGTPGRKAKKGGWRTPARIVIYTAISFVLANTFLAYFVGTDNLRQWVLGSPLDHPLPFLLVVAVTALMLFDFGFFREQLCILACPYGRFQSVMLDRSSLIITYDPKRGEPRGKAKRRKSRDIALPVVEGPPNQQPRGDCIDCHMCVTCCPTGIDIREGLQLECINCAQCIDACDTVMDKIGKPRGLIRYGSQAAVLDGERSRMIRGRTIVYPTLVLALITAFSVILISRAPSDVSILRARGAPFTLAEDQTVVNPATLTIQNRTVSEVAYSASFMNFGGAAVESDDLPLNVGPGESTRIPVRLRISRDAFENGRFVAKISIDGDDGSSAEVKFQMFGPARSTP